MIKRITQRKICLIAILLVIFLSSCEQLTRKNNREPESAPQDFTVTSNVYGMVFFAWSPVTGATEYEIFYSPDENSSTATSLASTNLTNFNAELTPGEPYYFWIRAKNGTIASSYSSMAYVTVGNTLPVPTGLLATPASYGEVSLTWNAVIQASSYEVFYSADSNFSTADSSLSTKQTNMLATLTPSIQYYFWVQAKNGTVTSPFSDMASASAPNTVSAPQGFTAMSNTYGEVTLTWDSVTHATSYEIFYSEDSYSSNTSSLGSTDLTYFTAPLTPGKRYYFWAKAKNDTTISNFSTAVSVIIESSLPSILPPSGLVATSSSYEKISLTWDTVFNATSYEIFYSMNSDLSTANSFGSTHLTQFDSLLMPSMRYYFWVKAKNATATSSFSSVASVSISESLIETILVDGGTFLRAGGFQITLSSFYMGKYEVTQKQWLDMTGDNPSQYRPTTGWYDYPIENINWYDIIEFCNMLSEAEGLEVAYTIQKNSNDPNDQSRWVITCDFTKNGYRLPTEAEWEYAARGGIHQSAFAYAGSNTIGDVAWYPRNSSFSETHAVGGKNPNALGLYDMSGNVAEWCWDLFANYPTTNQTNPTGPTTGYSRIYRGGDSSRYYYNTIYWTLPDRKDDYATDTTDPNDARYRGFRVVRSILPR